MTRVLLLGGVAAGAWDERGSLIGFVFGITGIEGGRPVHWSDMLAVRPAFRDVGLGWRLKIYQRRVLLERGVRSCYWTFDPLESRNAYLNFSKLGAVAVPIDPAVTGSSIPDAASHLDLFPARVVALVGNVAGTIAAVGVALMGLRRRPLGNSLIIGGIAVAAAGSALAGLGGGGGSLFTAAAALLLYAGFVSRR